MTKMMQGNMTMMVPQMIMMSVIPHFFSGFVLGKIPFPLTPSFKGMLQRGIDFKTLDTAYITSMSWCMRGWDGEPTATPHLYPLSSSFPPRDGSRTTKNMPRETATQTSHTLSPTSRP
jgi:hypothetical protein